MKKLSLLVMPLMAVSLLMSCGSGDTPEPQLNRWYTYEDWWNYCSNGNVDSEAAIDDVGKIVPLTVNGQVHKVRLIDVDKDVDRNGNKIHTTFEFANLISDENGYSLASLWQDDEDGEDCNFDYLNSTIRKNLVGYGNGKIMWYEKDSATRSSRSQSVLDMLPSDLRSVLKIAKKKVNLNTTGSWVETDLRDELFLLSANEMNEQTPDVEKGNAYEYYKNAKPKEADPIRIKQQVKGTDGARIDSLAITDNAYGFGYSYAGHNSSTTGEGGYSWLRSPGTDVSYDAWIVSTGGRLYIGYVCNYAFAFAPAFCI
ncbi:MAG: DUF6273 domain-containing protein [Bacilli bacterium]|nr:DUF6273 domain-containing protein [Bacilli bacterium]